MKKFLGAILFVGTFLFFFRDNSGFLCALNEPPQFRIWKSSDFQSAPNYGNVFFSSEPVIFHMIVGSPTFNTSGNSFFAIYRSTGDTFTSDASTRIYVPLDVTPSGGWPGLNVPFDILVASRSYISKQGAAKINLLWDYYRVPPNYTTGGDAQSSGRNP